MAITDRVLVLGSAGLLLGLLVSYTLLRKKSVSFTFRSVVANGFASNNIVKFQILYAGMSPIHDYLETMTFIGALYDKDGNDLNDQIATAIHTSAPNDMVSIRNVNDLVLVTVLLPFKNEAIGKDVRVQVFNRPQIHRREELFNANTASIIFGNHLGKSDTNEDEKRWLEDAIKRLG